MSTDGKMMAAALAYAERFRWPVFPLRPRGKNPLTQHGVKDATTDLATIRRWWTKWPGANIGVACGPAGLLVVDLDRKGDIDGLETWRDLKNEHCIDDSTVTNLTPSGGMHLVYAANGAHIGNSAGKLGPRVDVRGEGGYIVVPPSVGENGGQYSWDEGFHPLDHKPAPVPEPLLKLLQSASQRREATQATGSVADRVPTGERNVTLTSLAGTMRHRGMTELEIRAALLKANEGRCDPPLGVEEVERIAESVARYEPGATPPRGSTQTQPSDLKTLYQSVIDAPEEKRVDALQQLVNALVTENALTVEEWAQRIKDAGLMGKGAFRNAMKEAQRAHRKRTHSASGRLGGVPRIVDDGDLAAVTKRAWEAISLANDPEPTIFRYGGVPTRIECDDEGGTITRAMNEDRMRHHLARVAEWWQIREQNEGASEIRVPPPMAVVRDVLATPDLPLPILTGLVATPVFAPHGTLQDQPGYCAAGRVYYSPADGFVVPSVSGSPSDGEVARARQLIVEDLLGDFPFTGDAERAHAVALFLLPYSRLLIDGPTPLHLVEKPAPGTGGTLLIDVLMYPAMGQPVGALTEGRSEEEWRKRLTAKLISAPQVIFIDNLCAQLDSSALAAAITAPFWEDRILGQSTIIRVPVQCVWAATGNNPSLSNEMARRTVRIRIDSRQDRPWLRGDFHHPNLHQWAVGHRGELVWAALTLIQKWFTEGQPRGSRTLGMFEQWSAVMGGILETSGINGFLGNLEELYEHADADGTMWRSLVATWWEKHGDKEVGVGDLLALVIPEDLPLDLGRGTERSQRTRLGKLLVRQRDRAYRVGTDGEERVLTITWAGQKLGANRWQLRASGEVLPDREVFEV